TVIADNTGGHLMQHGMVDMAIVGTDRVTAQGDVCNKIGTYLKALAAKDNNVPFYVALPSPFFFSSRRRHTRLQGDWSSRVLFRSRRIGTSISDLGPMRAVKRQALIDLGLTDRRSGWPLEMVLRAARAGWTIRETPVLYRARTG